MLPSTYLHVLAPGPGLSTQYVPDSSQAALEEDIHTLLQSWQPQLDAAEVCRPPDLLG